MKSSFNLIIPMAGKGKRFLRAGYRTFKPFIPIMGKPMVKFVTDAFPQSVRKFAILNRSMLTLEQAKYLERDLKCEIVDIPHHDEGAAFSIYQARNKLPLDESFFVSYCDIYWDWDFEIIRPGLDHDGVIYTHCGFHPHLIKNNFSAFCLPKKNDPLRLKEIREKSSYTKDWMDEHLSIGIFYIKSGRDMIAGITDMITNNIRVDGEYFPSLLFNYLVAKNRDILLQELGFYIHWGVPEQLQDFQRWHTIITHDRDFQPIMGSDYPDNIVTMAGLGNRMRRISEQPKALMPICGMPMFKFVMEHFPSRSSTVIVTPEIGKILNDKGIKAKLFVLNKQTQSQYETLLLARDILCDHKDFFLTSCDAYGLFDVIQFRNFTNTRQPDAVIFTFEPPLSHKKMSEHHSHVSVDKDKITSVHIKSKANHEDLGFAGFFWVKDGSIFKSITEVPRAGTNEMYVDHVLKYFVDIGLDIVRFDLNQYVHLGTPEEFLEYRYWKEREFLFSEADIEHKVKTYSPDKFNV